MTVGDPNALMAAAERAFREGRLDEARRMLDRLVVMVPTHPAPHHLRALVARRQGEDATAEAAFRRAAALAPDDPAIRSNLGNLLDARGDAAGALACYDAALAIAPAFADARYNRAVLLQKMGQAEEALAALDALAAASPADARVQSARGGALRALDRPSEAAAAFDRALALDSQRDAALRGRARIALERGEAWAADLHVRALTRAPGDPGLVLGLVRALDAAGDPAGAALMAEVTAARPEWAEGQEVYAAMRAERGETDYAAHFATALASRPGDLALNVAHWRSLAHGERFREAFDAIASARPHLADDPAIDAFEAAVAGDAGDPARADALLARMPETAETLLMRGRNRLRAGDPVAAAAALGRAVDIDPGLMSGWAHLGLAWRLTGDARADWLLRQPGLIGTIDLPLSADEIAATANRVRALHTTRAHPIGQSLRGGTQTRGRLFWRDDDEIVRLKRLLDGAVADHLAQLPPADERHPLLRHRDAAMRLAGSWSVRLTGGGHHVPHIHPEGLLSSACYLVVPPAVDARWAGWLELGGSPEALGLPLDPLLRVEPRPGRLALFPSYMFHGTRPFAAGERLTVAFDVVRAGRAG